MRIISGSLGGRTFNSPQTNRTHPMSDKIRGAAFNMLGDVHGLTVLDAFAGSGALGFETISRGANGALLVELDKKAFATILQNIASLNLESKVKATRRNVSTWSDENKSRKFDIVFCDPPYEEIKESILHKLARNVEEQGVLVVSWPSKSLLPDLQEFEILGQKTYGNAKIVIYRFVGSLRTNLDVSQ